MTWLESYQKQPFPLDVFPPSLQEYVEATAESVCVHPEMLCTFMLPIFGALIGKSRFYGYKDDWVEYARIYAAVIADPGTKKSPALTRVLAPVQKLQSELNVRNRQALDAWKSQTREEKALNPTPPPWAQIILDNSTIEAIAKAMHSNPSGIVMKKDELSGWLTSMGQYKQGRGDDRQQWLEFWSGGYITINRVGNEHPIEIAEPYICLVGGLQPDKAHILLSQDDDGLVYRFLLAAPPAVAELADTQAVTTEMAKDYERICRELRKLPQGDAYKRINDTADGRKIIVQHMQRILDEKSNPELPSALKGYWAKFEAYLLRLTVVLVELWKVCGAEERVDEERAEQAAALVDYYKGQVLSVFSEAGIVSAPTYERASPRAERKILDWLTSHQETTLKRLMHSGPVRDVTRKDMDEMLGRLESSGLIEIEMLPRRSVAIRRVASH